MENLFPHVEEAGCTPAPGVPLLVVVCASGCSAAAKTLQSCPTLFDPIDGSPSGSRVPGILQARVLEWGATAFSAPVALVEASSSDILCRRQLGVDFPLADPPGLEPLPTSSVVVTPTSPRPALSLGWVAALGDTPGGSIPSAAALLVRKV